MNLLVTPKKAFIDDEEFDVSGVPMSVKSITIQGQTVLVFYGGDKTSNKIEPIEEGTLQAVFERCIKQKADRLIADIVPLDRQTAAIARYTELQGKESLTEDEVSEKDELKGAWAIIGQIRTHQAALLNTLSVDGYSGVTLQTSTWPLTLAN